MATRWDMVAAGREAVARDVQYVYGAKPSGGEFRTYTEAQIDALRDAYGSSCVWWSDSGKAGSLCCDCSGLITKGCGVLRGSGGFRATADEDLPVSEVWNDWSRYVGWALWLPGHIGIVSDVEGYYYALDGSARNAVHYPMARQGWTRLIKLCDVDYDAEAEPEESEDEVTADEIIQAVASGIDMQGYVTRCTSAAPIAAVSNDGGSVYRVYEPKSGDHLFTTAGERDALLAAGWNDEGVAWVAPAGGTVPIYRLYNGRNGDHMLTADYDEANGLYKSGWTYEGVPFFASGEGQAVHRLYNPNGGDHMLTASEAERDSLEAAGWTYEGVAFNA